MPSDKQATERLDNLSAIIKVIRSKGHITRRELASRLSLSWGCISELIGMLVADGTVIEEKLPPSDAKGRIPLILTLSDCKKILGVDINKTGLSCCVCSLAGETLYEYNSSLSTDSKGELLRDVFSSVTKMQNKFPDICISGFAMQGIKDADSGCWSFSNNIKINFENDIASHLNISAVVEHDPNCMLLGCMNDENKESKMLLRIDKAIGAAIYKFNGFFNGGLLELGYDDTYSCVGINQSKIKEKAKIIEAGGFEFLERLGYKYENGIFRIIKPNEERIALFCHGAMTRVWMSVLFHIPYHIVSASFSPTHTGVTVLEFKNNSNGVTAPKCLCFSDMSHLYADGLDMKHNNKNTL
jgi:hypothetical protein